MQEAKTNFLPQVNLGYNYTPAQRFPVIKIPAGVFGPEEQSFQAGFAQQNVMQLFINQPIYTGGRLNNAYGITTSSLDASKLELDRTRQEIEYRVVETFYAALMNERGVAVAEEQIRMTETQLQLARVRFESGTVARLDVLQAEVELANAKARRIQQRAQVDTSMQALRSLLSLPQSQALKLEGSLDEPVIGHAREELDKGLPQRPDLQAFTARRHAAEYSANLAQGEWKPSLAFAGNMQYQQDSVGSLLGRDNQSYAFGIQLNVPLFAAPGASARRGIAQSQMRQAEHGLRVRHRQRAARARIGVDGARSVRRGRGDAGKGAGARARERADRPGIVRERRHHLRRAERHAGAAAADRVVADAGEVRAHHRGGAGQGRRRAFRKALCDIKTRCGSTRVGY